MHDDTLGMVDDLELSAGFVGDALELFLEKQAELVAKSSAFDDVDEFIAETLEELSESGFAIFAVDDTDEDYPAVDEDPRVGDIVDGALARRKTEGRAVRNVSHVVISAEGHVWAISHEHPETSSVIRVAS